MICYLEVNSELHFLCFLDLDTVNNNIIKLLPARGWLRSISRTALHVGAALVVINVVFLLLHVALNYGYVADRGFHLEVDQSYSEQFQYLLYGICALTLGVLAVLQFSPLRLCFALLFALLLLEDSMSFHENFYLFADKYFPLSPMAALTVAQLWELVYTMIVGITLLSLLTYALLRSTDEGFKERAKFLLLCIMIMAGFGIGADQLHAMSQNLGYSAFFESLLGVVEDWGEMLSLSAMTVLVVDDWVYVFRSSTTTKPVLH